MRALIEFGRPPSRVSVVRVCLINLVAFKVQCVCSCKGLFLTVCSDRVFDTLVTLKDIQTIDAEYELPGYLVFSTHPTVLQCRQREQTKLSWNMQGENS